MEYIGDIEANGFNPDKIHCMVFNGNEVGSNFLASLTEDDYLIGHNFQRYDIPVIERICGIKIKAKIVDTLALSWYLYPKRNKHGLDDWGEEFGVLKPKITDWENLSKGEYLHRCHEDVKINTLLWERQKAFLTELYGENGYWDLVEYLSFKMHCAALQEQHKWRFDEDNAKVLLQELTEKHEEAIVELEAVMPAIPKYKQAKRPAAPFKMDGTLSVHGENWYKICEDNGIDFDSTKSHKIPNGFSEPSATSPQQIKQWLFDLGWTPETFKYVDDGVDERGYNKKRAVAQIRKDKELCPSIIRLADKNPELKRLENLGVISHRKSLVAGLLDNCEDGYVKAQVQGLTNTLRFKHKVCVNLPSERKPYGSRIRALFLAEPGEELCGSDMCSLEDRTKQHFMMPFDPDYVAEMNKEDYDAHLDIAIQAGFLTQEQSDAYKANDFSQWTKEFLSEQRYRGKTTNYSSTYKAGALSIARGAGVTLDKGEILKAAYWKRNWSLTAIEEAQETKIVNGITWLLNPVSKFWYVLRTKKDIFSTLNQGTATYCFDMWVKEILKKPVKIVAQFHDEVVLSVKTGYRPGVTKYLKSCVKVVNSKLKLNRELDVDVEFGNNYAEVH